MMALITSGCGLKLAHVWPETPIRDTSCCCRPLTGAPRVCAPGPRAAVVHADALHHHDRSVRLADTRRRDAMRTMIMRHDHAP